MSFEKHPAFRPAPSKNSTLWRFMTLPKYLSLLHNKKVYFRNLEKIAQDDPFEGTLPTSAFVHRSWKSVEDLPDYLRGEKNGDRDNSAHIHNLKESAELKIRRAYAYRKSYFINCWYLSEYDSPAMWNVFSDKNEGIAIRSSEARFEKAFSAVKQSVMGGIIEYGDFFDVNFVIDDKNAFLPVLHKRKDFSYENEYRLVYWDTAIVSKKVKSRNGYFVFEEATIPGRTATGIMNVSLSIEELENQKIIDAIEIDCDINELIEDIVISPLANDMFFKLIEDISKDKYGLKAPVIRSKLLSESLK